MKIAIGIVLPFVESTHICTKHSEIQLMVNIGWVLNVSKLFFIQSIIIYEIYYLISEAIIFKYKIDIFDRTETIRYSSSI